VSGWHLRQWYKIRPSKIVEKQTDGFIVLVNTSTREITVSGVPVDRVTGGPIDDTTLIDVIAPNASHELHLVSSPISIFGAVITLPAGTDMSRISAGDYVRAEDQSEWPMLPQEFHRTLADAAAVVILSDVGTADKAAALAGKVGNDIERMVNLLEPRVQNLAAPFVPRYGAIRGTRRRSPPARV
jgi:hypothetical protein